MKKIKTQILLLSILFAGIFMMPSCGGGDDGPAGPSMNSQETMSSSGKYSVFLARMDELGLLTKINGSSQVTILAVTDNQLIADDIDLANMQADSARKFINYHIINGKKLVKDFPSSGYVSSDCAGGPNGEKLSIYTEVTGENVRFNGNNYILKTETTNGIIYEMELSLIQPTILMHLAINSNISIYRYAVNLNKTIKDLLGTGAHTVFATTTPKFEKYLNDNNTTVALMHPVERQKILENSTMDGSVKASLLSGTMTTLGDDMVVTSVSGELTLNGKAKVVHKDVQCVNGLMHVIDNLLN